MKQINKNYILSRVYFFTLLCNNVENIKSYETTVLSKTGFLFTDNFLPFLNTAGYLPRLTADDVVVEGKYKKSLAITSDLSVKTFIKNITKLKTSLEKFIKTTELSRPESQYLRALKSFLAKLNIVLKQMTVDSFDFIAEESFLAILQKISESSGTVQLKSTLYFLEEGGKKRVVKKNTAYAVPVITNLVFPKINAKVLLLDPAVNYSIHGLRKPYKKRIK